MLRAAVSFLYNTPSYLYRGLTIIKSLQNTYQISLDKKAMFGNYAVGKVLAVKHKLINHGL